jgi:hypothetical protein
VAVVGADLVLGGFQRECELTKLATDPGPLLQHDLTALGDGAGARFHKRDVALQVLDGHSRQAHPGQEHQPPKVCLGVLPVSGRVASREDKTLMLVVPKRVRRQTDERCRLGDTLGCRRGVDR